MNNPLISGADAQRLNSKFQKEVDPRLFLFCNYVPTFPRPVSDDGAYYIGIQDLYKFAVDSGCIVKEYYNYIPNSERHAFADLGRLLDNIKTLRSMTDHNQSPDNGRMDKQTIDDYNRWVTQIIGKNTPDSIQDYQKLSGKLADIAASLIDWVEKFIDFISHSPQKADLIEKMISRILGWYSSNTITRIYEGQLLDAYLVRSKSYIAERPQWQLQRKVGKWIVKAEIFPFEEEIRKLDQNLQKIQASIDLLNTPGNPWSTLPEKDKQSLLESLTAQKAKNTAEQHNVQEELDERISSIDGKPYRYLFDHLRDRLRETMELLDSEGTSYNLLPQNLLQIDVDRRFRGVPSPESDF